MREDFLNGKASIIKFLFLDVKKGSRERRVEGTSVPVIDNVSEVKDERLGLLPEAEIRGHVLPVCPANTGMLLWLRGRRAPDFNVAEIHDGEAIKLHTFRDDGEVESDAIECAVWWLVVGCNTN